MINNEELTFYFKKVMQLQQTGNGYKTAANIERKNTTVNLFINCMGAVLVVQLFGRLVITKEPRTPCTTVQKTG